ncbi:STAS/SEC14 domain-containing protein [Microbulbifer variabilis]|uniref:STAS/SEC14 domain-containing protein n=1 Tax=Microbulbifer variabilis TaxID=266805 RepID=UPI001CFE8528|nr:STAS/SEC14 domain-containing protein [Microbulbifer variabilis]
MSDLPHGVSIGLEQNGNHFFLTLRARGKLTHEDYQTMVPMLNSALAGVENPKIDCLMDASELEGWEPRAAWDDLKLGLSHGRDFNRVAVISDKRWMKIASKVGSWFIGGEYKVFDSEDSAMAWLREEA